MNAWKHNGNEAKFTGQKIFYADFGPVTDPVSSLSLHPWPNPNSPSSPSNGDSNWTEITLPKSESASDPPDPAPTPDD